MLVDLNEWSPSDSSFYPIDHHVPFHESILINVFLILVVDELHNDKYLTKLDLCSGYHQVHMNPTDITKTAFRTHDALYEFHG
jgi:hypothetical protein